MSNKESEPQHYVCSVAAILIGRVLLSMERDETYSSILDEIIEELNEFKFDVELDEIKRQEGSAINDSATNADNG